MLPAIDAHHHKKKLCQKFANRNHGKQNPRVRSPIHSISIPTTLKRRPHDIRHDNTHRFWLPQVHFDIHFTSRCLDSMYHAVSAPTRGTKICAFRIHPDYTHIPMHILFKSTLGKLLQSTTKLRFTLAKSEFVFFATVDNHSTPKIIGFYNHKEVQKGRLNIQFDISGGSPKVKAVNFRKINCDRLPAINERRVLSLLRGL